MASSKCSYLENKEQTLHYKVLEHCETHECEALVERGFRRFGASFFRPVCDGCDECKTIKIIADEFVFSKSARRVLRKAKDITTHIQKPTMSKEHLRLFEKYHLHMRDKKGWEYTNITPQHYYNSFVDAHHDFGYEILYFYKDELIGVDLIDMLDDGISSIYFYYDPDFSHYALGKLSLYNQILLCKKLQKRWVHLGYYVKDCSSLSYKAEYKPYLTLRDRPLLSQPFVYDLI
ncbi:MAG: arginyltransferase [Sulfurimonadaceae bacterium]|nr:arginyltransferase [Sulfurimonadaceae bacterium]